MHRCFTLVDKSPLFVKMLLRKREPFLTNLFHFVFAANSGQRNWVRRRTVIPGETTGDLTVWIVSSYILPVVAFHHLYKLSSCVQLNIFITWANIQTRTDKLENMICDAVWSRSAGLHLKLNLCLFHLFFIYLFIFYKSKHCWRIRQLLDSQDQQAWRYVVVHFPCRQVHVNVKKVWMNSKVTFNCLWFRIFQSQGCQGLLVPVVFLRVAEVPVVPEARLKRR